MGWLIFIGAIYLLIWSIVLFSSIGKRIGEILAIRNKDIEKKEEEVEKKKLEIKNMQKALSILVKEKTTGFPWLADKYAEYVNLVHKKTASYLITKPNPARKAAEQIRDIRLQYRDTEKRFRITESLLKYYEYLFPWLEQFREGEDIDDFIRMNTQDFGSKEAKEVKDDFDPAKFYLTEGEWNQLSSEKRSQIALDRYWEKQKSSWEIGRLYERYIGYLHEKDGWKVEYVGSILGFEDMGRDLIVKKGVKIKIIQCKYWSKVKKKIIHEKHINQIFGTTIKYWLDHLAKGKIQLDLFSTGLPVQPALWTSTSCSDVARDFATALRVEIKEDYPLSRYPCIKCNVNRVTNEKIYHLPFDQQYDHIIIEPKRGECYVNTTIEAEELGFRRAYRWRGSKDNEKL